LPRSTYFILLTPNHTRAENYALATAAGIDDFLTKPLDREAIRMRLAVAERNSPELKQASA
jgi:DNA-binding response OmpR family regulator